MARTTNGTSDFLNTASTLDWTATPKIVVAFWLWWNTFANDDAVAFEHYDGSTVEGFLSIIPNSSGASAFEVTTHQAAYASRFFTRPSAGTWHHYVVNTDMGQTSTAQIPSVYVDGVSQSLTDRLTGSNPGFFNSATTYAMSRTGSTLFAAGRLAELAIWAGINFTGTDVSNLYNGGVGTAATNVQNGSLTNYWSICGAASPETATVGGINLTVTGTTQSAHPIAGICAGFETLMGAMVL